MKGGTLSTDQITAILDGKRVLAPAKEIVEARNAIMAYEHVEGCLPTKEKDLLITHPLMMESLVDFPGVGVRQSVSGDIVVHMGPQASRGAQLMSDLLCWLGITDTHPLIANCVFHYEFEFIHPFADGSSRMGRLWQSLILSKWHEIFNTIPEESLIHQHQDEYYLAIRQSIKQSDSSFFIEFMLRMVFEALKEAVNDGVNATDAKSFELLSVQRMMSQDQLDKQLGKSKSTVERTMMVLKWLDKIKSVGSDKTGYWQVLSKG